MAEESQRPKDIKFIYEKARHHRTMHANGAWAALTPQAQVQLAFYNDLRRMPISVTHEIQDDDTLGPPSQQEISDLVREVDVTVVLSVGAAKAIVGLINQMIEQAEALINEKKTAQESNKETV